MQVKRARNLFETGLNELRCSYVTCTLLPDTSQRKVSTVAESPDPKWRESFVFEGVTVEEIAKERVLEVSVWDSGNDRFIGGLRTGPLPNGSSQNYDWMDSNGDEVSHWGMILAHPGEWAEQWHALRENMKPTTSSPNDIATSNLGEDEFRKVDPNKRNDGPKDTPKVEESASKKRAAFLSNFKDSNTSGNKKDEKSHGTSPPRHTTPEQPVDQFRKTQPKVAKPTTSNLDKEFCKVIMPQRLADPTQKSATLDKTVASSPAMSLLAGPGSSSSLPHSIPPLTLEEFARSSDPLRPRSSSPESSVVTPGSTLERSSNQMMVRLHHH